MQRFELFANNGMVFWVCIRLTTNCVDVRHYVILIVLLILRALTKRRVIDL